MTRKDYIAIAAAVARSMFPAGMPENTGVALVACAIADVMALDNPRFDRARFLKACGVQS